MYTTDNIIVFDNTQSTEIIPREYMKLLDNTDNNSNMSFTTFFDISVGANPTDNTKQIVYEAGTTNKYWAPLSEQGNKLIISNQDDSKSVYKFVINLVDHAGDILIQKEFLIDDLLTSLDDMGNTIIEYSHLSLLEYPTSELSNIEVVNELETLYKKARFITITAFNNSDVPVNLTKDNINTPISDNYYLIIPIRRLGTTDTLIFDNTHSDSLYKIGIIANSKIITNFEILKTNILSTENDNDVFIKIRTDDYIGFISNNKMLENELNKSPTNIFMVPNDVTTKTMEIFTTDNDKFRLDNDRKKLYQPYDKFYTSSNVRFKAYCNQFCKFLEVKIYNAESYKKWKNKDADEVIELVLRYHHKITIDEYEIDLDLDLFDILKIHNFGKDIYDVYEDIMVVVEITDFYEQFIKYEMELQHFLENTSTTDLHHYYTPITNTVLDYNKVNYNNKDLYVDDFDFTLNYDKNISKNKIDTYLNVYANNATETITKYKIQLIKFNDNSIITEYNGKLNRDDDDNVSTRLYLEKDLINLEKFIYIRVFIYNDCNKKFLSIKKKCSKTYDTKSLVYNDRYKFRLISSILHENKSIVSKLDSYYSYTPVSEKSELPLLNIAADENTGNTIKVFEEIKSSLPSNEQQRIDFGIKIAELENMGVIELFPPTGIEQIPDNIPISLGLKMDLLKKASFSTENHNAFGDDITTRINFLAVYLYFPPGPPGVFSLPSTSGRQETEDLNELFKTKDPKSEASTTVGKTNGDVSKLLFFADNASLNVSTNVNAEDHANMNNFIKIRIDSTSEWMLSLHNYNNGLAQNVGDPSSPKWIPKLIIVTDRSYQEHTLINDNDNPTSSYKFGNIFEPWYFKNPSDPGFSDFVTLVLDEGNSTTTNMDSENEEAILHYKVPNYDDLTNDIKIPERTIEPEDEIGYIKNTSAFLHYAKFQAYQVTKRLCSIRGTFKYLAQEKLSDNDYIIYKLYRNEGTSNDVKLILQDMGEINGAENLAHGLINVKFSATLDVERYYTLNYTVVNNGVKSEKVFSFNYKPSNLQEVI